MAAKEHQERRDKGDAWTREADSYASTVRRLKNLQNQAHAINPKLVLAYNHGHSVAQGATRSWVKC